MKLMNQLERKLYRFRIAPFFKYIIFAMAGIYALNLFFPSFGLYFRMLLFMPLVYRGEVWRLISFIIIPPAGSILFAALNMYFYYFIGTALESKWGARRFLLYFIIGVVGAILAAVISGIGTNHFLLMSMFFAFAILYPENELLLFFVLPVKMKWLGLLNAVYYLYALFIGSWADRAALVFSLVNLFLFFGGDLINLTRSTIAQWKRRRQFRSAQRR